MKTFYEWWLQKRDETFRVSPSIVDDEGDDGDRLAKSMPKPGAFPTYGDDLPITDKNRQNKLRFMKKNCKCR